jgi:sugar O-acyltransferase (sialic acid O-acetyltransferase NeuD family)
MAKIVIFGNTTMAQLAHLYFKNDSPHEIVAFTVNKQYMKEESFGGLPVIPFEKVSAIYPPCDYKMFIAVGYKQLNRLRAQKYAEAKKLGYELVSYVHSKATCWSDLVIGDNCFILENQVIQPGVTIGDDVVLWSGNHIGHGVDIKDHCWISSHVVCSGEVSIGEYTFIGVNAAIKDRVKIGRRCVIGMGAIINRDTEDGAVYASKPAQRRDLKDDALERLL